MYRVLITDDLSPAGLNILEAASEIEIDKREEKLSVEELRAALQQADGIIIRSSTKLTAEVLEGQERLKVIVRAGVGVDNIDLQAATKAGVVVMNTPEGNTTSTAELTIALMMGLARNIGPAYASMKEGLWNRKHFTGTQLLGKTLALVGIGRVGQEVARKALGLKMHVIGFDPYFPEERAADLGIELCRDLDEMLTRCDYLSIHSILNDQTRGMINAERMKKMKKSVCIINCARGGIVVEEDLLEALNSEQVAGAALDVYSQEPPPADSKLVKHPHVLATPHLGASTTEAQTNVATEAADILIDFLLNKEVHYAINMAPISGAEMEEMQHFLALGYRLGLLLAQLSESENVKGAEIVYRGKVAEKKTNLITSCFAAGLLEPAFKESVNMVNATIVAQQRGIPITETSSKGEGDFATIIQAKLITDQGVHSASGTIFGYEYLRLVRLGAFHLDAFLDGNLLIYRHIDRPGQIGRIGQILGKHQVNIADMSLGRKEQKAGGDSIAVLHLDDLPCDEALEEIGDSEDVTGVQVVKLPTLGEPVPWLSQR